jgi:hypothetical protein
VADPGEPDTHAGTLPLPDDDRVAEPELVAWAPGTRVDHYVVLARIGAGAMGAVYRAEDVDLGRAVALKRLHVDGSDTARARLMREARAAAALQHPNVVTVHEVAEAAGTPFLAMASCASTGSGENHLAASCFAARRSRVEPAEPGPPRGRIAEDVGRAAPILAARVMCQKSVGRKSKACRRLVVRSPHGFLITGSTRIKLNEHLAARFHGW